MSFLRGWPITLDIHFNFFQVIRKIKLQIFYINEHQYCKIGYKIFCIDATKKKFGQKVASWGRPFWESLSIECLKCIIKCLYQLVFKFCQFLDSKLTYLLNYCRFCDFEPFQGTFTLAHYEKGKIHIYQLKLQN